jgi:hypothetical protein
MLAADDVKRHHKIHVISARQALAYVGAAPASTLR